MNARDEFLEFIKDLPGVVCAEVEREVSYKLSVVGALPVGHILADWESFCHSINFDYDEGYGSQELYGAIWFVDGSWADRREYDGSEWWELQKCPEIPASLKGEES
jgi:hypothetical protein